MIVKPILFGLIENMQIRGHHSSALTEGVLYEKEKMINSLRLSCVHVNTHLPFALPIPQWQLHRHDMPQVLVKYRRKRKVNIISWLPRLVLCYVPKNRRWYVCCKRHTL